jgi:hypothetical protein
VGIYLSRKFIEAPLSVAMHPLSVAIGQGVVLAAVLVAAKLLVPVHAQVGLLLLMALGGAVCLALNLRDIRTLLTARVAR